MVSNVFLLHLRIMTVIFGKNEKKNRNSLFDNEKANAVEKIKKRSPIIDQQIN